jgi:hypothetical protein
MLFVWLFIVKPYGTEKNPGKNAVYVKGGGTYTNH